MPPRGGQGSPPAAAVGDGLVEGAGATEADPAVQAQGAIVLGLGFTLSPQEAQSWISTDQIYADVLFPYLNGQDVSSHPEHGAERYIINFGERREEQAREYPLAFERVHELVRPERITKDPEKYPRMVHEWWKFWNARPGLNAAISEISSIGAAINSTSIGFALMLRNAGGTFAPPAGNSLIPLTLNAPFLVWGVLGVMAVVLVFFYRENHHEDKPSGI